MKVEQNNKYTTIAVYSFIVACATILFYLTISQINIVLDGINQVLSILQPFIIGFAMAYIFNFVLKFYEEKLIKEVYMKKIGLKSKRGIGIMLTLITIALTVYLFFHFVFPQLMSSIVGLANDIPVHVNNATVLVNDLVDKLSIDIDEKYLKMAEDSWNDFMNYVIRLVKDFIPILGTFVSKMASSLWNLLIGLIVSIYLLIEKEKFFALGKKLTFALFNKSSANKVIELTHRSNDTFGKFLSGKILDSLIIGILTFITLNIFKMPYTLLISVIVGVTNIIPFFGPFIGAIPSFFIILFVSPEKALWFLLIIFIIQQLDGNFIGPKILGDSIGISAFWILFSIMVAGNLLGVLGMVIGVPLFAIFYSIVKELIEDKLRKKGLKVDTKDYM
jgi:predicted PurR-regulated permease PerM